MDPAPTPLAHRCTVAFVTAKNGDLCCPSNDLVREGDDLAPFCEVRYFNFCPFCGKPLDWVALKHKRRLPEANPRVRILDATGNCKPVAVVNVMEQDGAILMVGDEFDLSKREPYVTLDTEETNEAG